MRVTAMSVALVVLASALPVAGHSSVPLPFRLQGETDIVVPVMLNGQGPFRFLFDTGSSRSAISAETAQRLGLQPLGKTLVVTPSGQAFRVIAALDGLTVGASPPIDVAAMVIPGDDFGGGTGIDGLLGQDVLAGWIYTIDYARRQIVWHTEMPSLVRGTRLALELSEGCLIVSLPQTSSTTALLKFIPDSGANGFVLFARAGRALPPMTPFEPAGLRTLSGRRLVRRVMLDDLDVGAIRLRNQIAVLVDRAEPDSPLGDGLLPLHLFARVTFDGPGKVLIIEER